MTRRELGGVIPLFLVAVACGGDDDDDGPAVDAAAGGPDGTPADAAPLASFPGNTNDASGHFHLFTVQCADLGLDTVTYAATGSGHTHSIVLNAVQLSSLAAGATVTFETSDGHPHEWTVTKPANAC